MFTKKKNILYYTYLCNFVLDKSSQFLNPCGTGFWGPNAEEFERKFGPKSTKGEGTQWLRNLYFLYLVELRALQKAAPLLEQVEYYTGNDKEDEATRHAVHNFLSIIKLIYFFINKTGIFNSLYFVFIFVENSHNNLMSKQCFRVDNKHKN